MYPSARFYWCLTLNIITTAVFVILFFTPKVIRASTVYENKTFSGNITFNKEQGPIYLKGNINLQDHTTLVFQLGTRVFIEGQIQGRLATIIFEGSTSSKIQIFTIGTSTNNPIFNLQESSLYFEHVYIETQKPLVKAFTRSTVTIKDSNITSSNSSSTPTSTLYQSTIIQGSLISVWNQSTLNIQKTVFSNLFIEKGVEVFNSSLLAIDSTEFSSVGTQATVSVFDSAKVPAGSESTATIQKSNFTGGISTTGLEMFNSSIANVSLTNISEYISTGVRLYANAKIFIDKSAIFKNEYGIKSFSSSIQMHNSDIFYNSVSGVYAFGGNIDTTSNWWGSESGPYHIQGNSGGTGNSFIGTGMFSPWITSKKETCCSSVLFLPGIQGSRLYTRSAIGENQLWEPNYHSDIRKLSFTEAGIPAHKEVIYTRDVIDRTNITFGGAYDIQIYKGLISSLNNLQKNFSIEDYTMFPYDWRNGPQYISTRPVVFKNDGTIEYKKITTEIERLASISKTKKVTIIGHSYGGLVIKELLKILSNDKKSGLIDKVVFVGVPESGSVTTLGTLLHGDSQEIGSGLIVNNATMREFAQNLPSVYTLLPKRFTSLISGVASTTTIEKNVPSVNDRLSFTNFMKQYSTRPVDMYFREIEVPSVINKNMFDEYFENNVNSSDDSINKYPGIQFFNILGVGLQTPKGIVYKKVTCKKYISHPFIQSKNCGLGHEYVETPVGDGVVLADDVFDSTLNATRWGEKYVVNIGEYNRLQNANFSHASLVSAPPVLSVISKIITNDIDRLGLPQFVTRHGGKRTSTAEFNPTVGEVPNLYKPVSYIEHDDFMLSSVFEKNTDINPYLQISDIQKNIKQVLSSKPNTQVRTVGSSLQYVSEHPTQKIIFRSSESRTESDSTFNLRVTTSVLNGTVSTSPNSQIHEYISIPVSENSIITYTNTSSGSTLNVKDVYEGVYEKENTYTTSATSSLYEFKETFPDFLTVLNDAKNKIQSSGVRQNFKERYVRKIESMKKKYDTYIKAGVVSSSGIVTSSVKLKKYSDQIKNSLDVITSDLSKVKSVTYKGGLSKNEASFLGYIFTYIDKALEYHLQY